MYSKKKNLAMVYGICETRRQPAVRKKQTTRATHLARPEGDDGAEGEAGLRLELAHLAERGEHGDGEGAGGAGLDLDLGHLQRAEGDIGEELGRGGARAPDEALVLGGRLLAGHVHVGVLEVLVETVLEEALERVAEKGRAEAFPETRAALLCDDGLQTGAKALVLGGVDLEKSC